MGYERSDNRYGRDQSFGARDQDRDYGRQSYGRPDSAYRSSGDYRSGYGRQPQGYDYEDRGFLDRAGDEVRSWFGDEEAERRRRFDEQNAERDYRRAYGSGDYGRGDRGRSDYDRPRSDYGAYGRGREDRGQSYAERGAYGGYGAGGYGGAGGGYTSGGDFGAGQGAGATGSWGLGAGRDRETWGTDHGYRSWRDKQVEALDRDYDDYRREHQSKFEQEFHGWRQNRQTQRDSLGKVSEHQDVVGSDGQHVGTVDKVRGDRIILTKNDADAGGHHHSIPSSWIQSVDDKVTISKTADQAHAHWKDEERNSAFGSNDRSNDRGNDRDRGATNLNRSFSGTY